MPRKAKPTLSGKPGQAVSPVPGQMYGAGVEQAALQQAMPAPNARIQPSAAYTSPGTGQQMATAARLGGAQMDGVQGDVERGAIQGLSEAERYQRALDAARQMQGQAGLLTQPSNRPTEPITAGLSTGPGGGPEMMQMQFGSPTGTTLRRLSQITGDPYFRDLAAKAGL